MSTIIVETRITHKYLMNKTKWDLADMYMDLLDRFDTLQKECDVQDLKGNHCPEVPVYAIRMDGERIEIKLCSRCFDAVSCGVYGNHHIDTCISLVGS
jgi:hypothetical protein